MFSFITTGKANAKAPKENMHHVGQIMCISTAYVILVLSDLNAGTSAKIWQDPTYIARLTSAEHIPSHITLLTWASFRQREAFKWKRRYMKVGNGKCLQRDYWPEDHWSIPAIKTAVTNEGLTKRQPKVIEINPSRIQISWLLHYQLKNQHRTPKENIHHIVHRSCVSQQHIWSNALAIQMQLI